MHTKSPDCNASKKYRGLLKGEGLLISTGLIFQLFALPNPQYHYSAMISSSVNPAD